MSDYYHVAKVVLNKRQVDALCELMRDARSGALVTIAQEHEEVSGTHFATTWIKRLQQFVIVAKTGRLYPQHSWLSR